MKCPACDGKGYEYHQTLDLEVHAEGCDICSETGEIPDDIFVTKLKDPVNHFQDLIRGLNEKAIREAANE